MTNGEAETVSVLIAAYHAEKWIEQAVRSALLQEVPEGWSVEVLVGVDGCPATLDGMRRVEDRRITTVLFPVNRGTYNTLNSLLPLATGSLFVCLGADDIMLPGRLHSMVSLMSANPDIDQVGTWFTIADEDLQPLSDHRRCPEGVWMYRRSFWNQAIGGFQPWRCGADGEANLRAEYSGARKAVVPRYLYLRRSHANQLTSSGRTRMGSPLRRQTFAIREAAEARYKAGEEPGPLEVEVYEGEVV